MKKLYILFTCIITLLSVFAFNSVYASELTFDNTINDESTISEDFEALSLKLSDYYISKKHTIDKWYCVAVAESIINTNYDIQTYFYLYNPTVSPNDYITLNYKLNGTANSVDAENIEYSSTYGLLKVKGFKYAYTSVSTIDVYSISWVVDVDTMDGYGFASSDFTATTKHSINDKLIDVAMDFKSSLVIEDYNVVEVNVTADDNFINNWDEFWTATDTSLNIYFYNFNFPDHIEYDSVEYAKFNYIRKECVDEIFRKEKYLGYNSYTTLSEEPVTNEYFNHNKNGSINTNTLRVNDSSIEMSFDVFHLGNRYKDGQFTFDEEKIVSGNLDYFDRDCSILIDSTYKSTYWKLNLDLGVDAISDWYEYETLDQVELIELHYENDGVLYECRVIQTDGPVDNEDFGNVSVEDKEKEWWEKFWDWFLDNLPWSAVGCIAAIILAPVLISLLISLITGSVSTVLVGLASVLKKILKLLFKFIVWLIKLPFTVLKFIFGLFKK